MKVVLTDGKHDLQHPVVKTLEMSEVMCSESAPTPHTLPHTHPHTHTDRAVAADASVLWEMFYYGGRVGGGGGAGNGWGLCWATHSGITVDRRTCRARGDSYKAVHLDASACSLKARVAEDICPNPSTRESASVCVCVWLCCMCYA